MSQVLVLNTGSSSIKYQLFELPDSPEEAGSQGGSSLVSGTLGGVGEAASTLTHRVAGAEPLVINASVPDQEAGFDLIRAAFERSGGMPSEVAAVGHRVVHGGARFGEPVIVDDEVIAAIEELTPLAPLHNPSNLAGIRLAQKLYPQVPQVAVFDTAFHSTMPEIAYRYALPVELADRLDIRRYGFHGTSHGYVSRQAAEYLGRPPGELKLITLHLGNGASVAAVDSGRSVDTSMGMTPLEGLVMGTRSGDIDPAIVLYLQREGGLSVDEVDALLNRDSGLKGLTGSNDARRLGERAAAGDPVAEQALDIFSYRIRKYVGAYAAVLGRLDGVVFTAGIGENDPVIRAKVCAGLELLGIRLDPERNAGTADRSRPWPISTADSPVPVLVVPTNEELEIARQSLAVTRRR